MILSELLQELAFSELSNLAIARTGVLEPSSHPRVISAINTALVDLFSRVRLSEREVLIQTFDWKSEYFIRKEHAFLDPTPDVLKYILDTPDNPFTDDLVRLLGATNEVGDPLPVNDADQWASVFFPTFDSIQFNHLGENQVFSVQYQALHPRLVSSGEGYLSQPVRVPSVLIDLVRIKAAATIIAPMGGQDLTSKAQALEAIYEARLLNSNLSEGIVDSGVNTNVKLYLRGYP